MISFKNILDIYTYKNKLHQTHVVFGCVLLKYSIKNNLTHKFSEYNCVVTPIEIQYNAHYIFVSCMHEV